MSRILRQAAAILLLASFVAAAPVQARSFSRLSLDGAARIESAARGFLAFFLQLFASKGDTGSGMDPNGKPSPSGNP